MGVIEPASIDQLRGLFFADLADGDSRWFWCLADTFAALTG
jgi:hypothetical protein